MGILDAPSYTKAQAGALRSRLATRAGYDSSRSNGFSQAAAAAATRVTEAWADLSAWAVNGTSAQVSAGKVYGTTGGGGINRAFRIAPGMTARVVLKVNIVTTSATDGQGVFVGFNRNGIGATPGGGAAQSRGLYFRYNGTGGGVVNELDNGTQGSTIASGLGNSVWYVTLTVDENYFSIGLSAATGGAPRYVKRWARDDSTFPLNNLSIMLNDARGTSGSSVEPITEATIGATSSASFVSGNTPTAGQNAPSIHWGSLAGDNFLIMTPPGYDSRKPTPCAIVFHGNGSDELHWLSNANGKAVADALVADGFLVVAAANTGAVSTWGADAGLDAYTRAYQYARDHYNVGPVVFYPNSMGNIEALNVLAREAIPGVAALACTVPTFDLAENHANALFTSTIRSAYGIASDGSDYAAKTADHDPALMDAQLFRGIPVWMLVATDDAAVTPSANGQAFYAAIEKTNPRTKVEVTGGHSTGQIASSASTIVTFFNTVLGRRTNWAA